MTIASEITRLQWAKADIKSSIEWKWVSVPASAKLDTYSTYIDQIERWDPRWKFVVWTILRTWVITSVSSSDAVYFFWWEMSYVDNDVMILCRPWIYDNYSSSWSSDYTVNLDCFALDWTTLDFNRWGWSHWNFLINWSLSAKSYKCYREWDIVHFQLNYEFYRSEYSDTYYVMDAMYNINTKAWSSNEWTVDRDFRLDNSWNMNLYNASWEWCTSWKCTPIIKRTPVLS